jgi:formylglycine-generating enzyme required for sulfatase activity
MKKFTLILLMGWLCMPALQANNIVVANVSVTDQSALLNHCNVKFDLSWDNSWRAIGVPGNWDAAWVFVKYRIAGGEWQHASLDTSADNHTPASGSAITPSKDFKGVFIYRTSNGAGTNTWTNIKVRWKYGRDGVADDATLEVKVFAIEMVYIPQESFYLGDGNGTNESMNAFHDYNVDNTARIIDNQLRAVRVDASSTNDDDNAKWTNINDCLYVDGDNGVQTNGGPTPQNNHDWPAGYTPFYIMKYEVSQEQYMDFLNSLTRAQQVNRVATDISIGTTSVTNRYVMTNTVGMSNRNGIRCDATIPASDPVTFYCDYDYDGIGNETNDGQNIVCNLLSWPDHAAYDDWSGLRPMTELEYEKACRGPNNAVYAEYAWGTTNIFATQYTYSNGGSPNELFTNMGTNTGNALYTTTSGGFTFRCGIFAASSSNHTRQETGATYYGVMEMTGNLGEDAVHIGNVAGRSFTGLHGDGALDADGFGNVSYWPGINGNSSLTTPNAVYGGTTGITNYAGMSKRGGCVGQAANTCNVSFRSIVSSSSFLVRSIYYGVRSCHTAP